MFNQSKKDTAMKAITINNLKERHSNFISLWGKWDYNNPQEFAKNYDKEEFILHILLDSEFFYVIDEHTTKQALLFADYLFPETTKEELMNVYYKYLDIVREIYG